MGVGITYMGTKKNLAPTVAQVIARAKPGIMLDAFAGMCSVAEEVGTNRQIWTNDTQIFAAEAGRALFAACDEPPNPIWIADVHSLSFQNQKDRLKAVFASSLKVEELLLGSTSYASFRRTAARYQHTYRREVNRVRPTRHSLFSTIYGDSYFGIEQAIEADAVIAAIRGGRSAGAISLDHARWLKIALGRALLKISNSTGHFAQFLKPKRSTYKRFLSQRRRSVWAEWIYSIGELQAVGTLDWRARNKSFNEDSLHLVPRLATVPEKPAVIYADPPYTDDQYSRYYHLLDTLMLYDYPKTSGAGLYRPKRFTTPFSVKSKAAQALDELVSAAAALKADLVLSYPSDGLINESGVHPRDILTKHYKHAQLCFALPHTHSTFGASKGPAQSGVTEHIYLATL